MQHRGALAAGAAVAGMTMQSNHNSTASNIRRFDSSSSSSDALPKKRFRLPDVLPSFSLGVGGVQCEVN